MQTGLAWKFHRKIPIFRSRSRLKDNNTVSLKGVGYVSYQFVQFTLKLDLVSTSSIKVLNTKFAPNPHFLCGVMYKWTKNGSLYEV